MGVQFQDRLPRNGSCFPADLFMASPRREDSLHTTDPQHHGAYSEESLISPGVPQYPGQPVPQGQTQFLPAMQQVHGQPVFAPEQGPPLTQPYAMYGHQGSYMGTHQALGVSPPYQPYTVPVSVPMQSGTFPGSPVYAAQHIGPVQSQMPPAGPSPFPGVPHEHLRPPQQMAYFYAHQHHPLSRQQELAEQEILQEDEQIAHLEQQLQEKKKRVGEMKRDLAAQQQQQFLPQHQHYPGPHGVPRYIPGAPLRQPVPGYAAPQRPSIPVQSATLSDHRTSGLPSIQPYVLMETIMPPTPAVTQQQTFVPISPSYHEEEGSTLGSECSAPGAQDTLAPGSAAERHSYQLRQEAQEFCPRQSPGQQQRLRQTTHQHHRPGFKRSQRHDRQSYTASASRVSGREGQLQAIKQVLYDYAFKAMAPSSEPQKALEHIQTSVVRAPAACFNEQKFEDKKEGHKVLLVPQSPAQRGQEALARVCFALEQVLTLGNIGAAIISDYKFKECFMRHAPPGVREMLSVPEEEGSHDILIIGPQIGITCVQVTCIETSTNSGTVKKQVRETLKQLEKDVKVIGQVLGDLDLEHTCVRKVMALPNISSEELKQKLDLSFVKILMTALDTDDDLTDLLTLDRLPHVGHRHWSSKESRDKLLAWTERLSGRGCNLSLENYMQIFARYTCSWSVMEVWGMTKPRTEIRSLPHAVSETALRHHLPVLTPEEDSVLRSGESHVLIEASAGTGATCLLQIKARMELQRGCLVLVFIPRPLTGLREEYEQFAKREEKYAGNVYFWLGEEEAGARRGAPGIRFKSMTGSTKTLDNLKREPKLFALFDHVNREKDHGHLLTELTKTASAVWATNEVGTEVFIPKERYKLVQLTSMTRVPSSVQALIKHGLRQGPGRAQQASAQTAHPSGRSLSLPRDPQSLTEVSSYRGLPTDGPSPRFIWHPAATGCTVLQCDFCTSRLRELFVELLGEELPEAKPSEKKTAAQEEQDPRTQPSRGDQADRLDMPKRTAVGAEDETQAVRIEDLDINSRKVPPRLTVDDIVIFVDTQDDVEAIVSMMNLVSLRKVVHPLAHLPSLVGTEKPVVVYVGRLDMSSTQNVLHALVSQLGDVMTLCQGQLVLVLEVESDVIQDTNQFTPEAEKPNPYQLEIAAMLGHAANKHNQQ